MRTKIAFLLLSLTVLSCEKYIDMEIPDSGRKIVVNSLYSNSGDVVVNLFMSRFILDDMSANAISGAQVILSENGLVVDTLIEIEPGVYSTQGFTPAVQSTHTLRVTKNGVTVSAQCIIPYPVPIEFIDSMQVSRNDWDYLRLQFEINDPPEDNYYMIGFMILNGDTILNEKYPLYIYSDEPVVESYFDGFALFNDQLFNSTSFALNFDLELYSFFEDTTSLGIFFLSVSEEMYLYCKTLSTQQETMNSPFAEPVMVFSNIENGYGIFAGYSVFTDTIYIPRLSEDVYIID